MPIFQTAHYQVKAAAVDKVKDAIEEFVKDVKDNEPGTRMYTAWQEVEDPTRFVHLFIFENKAAHERHASSDAVRRFESVYGPELVSDGVTFTDYRSVASNREADHLAQPVSLSG